MSEPHRKKLIEVALPLEAVDSIIRCDGPAVHRRGALPRVAAVQMEDDGLAIRLLPALRDVTLHYHVTLRCRLRIALDRDPDLRAAPGHLTEF